MSADIPPIPESTPTDLKRSLLRMREELQRLLGLRGDPSEAAVRVADAASMTGSVTTVVVGGGSSGGGTAPAPDLTPPPTPTSLTVVAGFGQVIITWDGITYTQGNGHGRTLIYAVKRDPSSAAAPPTFGDAPLVADAPNALTIIALPSDPNTKWHVWAKFETNDGVVSVSPAGGTNGAQGTTGQDISGLLVTLAGQIRASELSSALSSRIDLVDAPATVPGSVSAKVKAEADARVAAIDQEVIDRNLAVAGGVSSAATYTQTYAYQKATGEQLAINFNALSTAVNNPTTGLAATRATLINSYATQSSVTDSIALATQSLEAYADTAAGEAQEGSEAAAKLYTESYAYAKITGDALANSVTTLSSQVISPSATPGDPAYNPTYAGLQTTQTTLATLDGRASTTYAVKTQITAGGRTVMGGFGLMGNSAAAPGTEIEFGVMANRFWVGAPSGTGIADSQFFTLQTTTWNDNGVSRPAGMFVDAAFIKNLQAVYATIASLVADDITAANITANQITAGALRVGGYLQSTNYTTGPSGLGWRISADGVANFPAASIRGLLTAAQIDTTGLTIKNASGTTILNAGAGQTLEGQISAAGIGAVRTDASNAPNSILNSQIGINASGQFYGGSPGSTGITISNNQILVSGGQLQGIGTAGVQVDNSYAALGQNLLANSDQSAAPAFSLGWVPNGATIESGAVRLSNGYSTWTTADYVLAAGTTKSAFVRQVGRNTTTIEAQHDGAGNTAAADIAATTAQGVLPGDRICASVYAVAHSCRVRVYLEFRKADGNVSDIDPYPFAAQTEVGTGLSNSLALFARPNIIRTAPADAAYVRLFVRKYDTFSGQAGSFVWLAAPCVERVNANATGPSPYMPGPPSSVQQLGYTGALNATYGADWAVNVTGATAVNESISAADTKAQQAKDSATLANEALGNIASDNVLTRGEKPQVVINWSAVSAEQSGILAQATAYGIVAGQAARDNYTTAVTTLSTYLAGLTPAWNDTATDTIIVGSTFRANWEAVFLRRQELLNRIAAVAGERAVWATVTGSGKPENDATKGAPAGTLVAGTDAAAVASGAANGSSAWGKFSGASNTLPAGNVEFNFAGSSSKGGNANNTNAVGTQTAASVQAATINFNARNDRLSTAVVAPTIANDGTALDHVANADASVTLSFEWAWAGNTADIDGFLIYLRDGGTATPSAQYVISGAADAQVTVFYVTPERRAIIFPGVSANNWWTVAVQAYRIVDADVAAAGVLKSAVVQPASGAAETTFGAYRPSANVAFTGNVEGTIAGTASMNGTAVSTVVSNAANALNGLTNKLNKSAADILTGEITLSSSGAIVVGNTTNGVIVNTSGIVGRKAGATTFSVSNTGDVVLLGDISGSTGTFAGSVNVAAGGNVRVGATDYLNGAGAFMGFDGGTPKFRVGDANQYLRWNGATLELKQDTMTVTIPGGNVTQNFATTSEVARIIGTSRTAAVSGGTAPHTYSWTLSVTAADYGGAIVLTGGGGTATAGFSSILPTNAAVAIARATCTVTDANGRSASASITASSVHTA